MSKTIRNFVILSIGVATMICTGETSSNFIINSLKNIDISSKILSNSENSTYTYSDILNTSNTNISNGNDTLIEDTTTSENSITSTLKSTNENIIDSMQYDTPAETADSANIATLVETASSASKGNYICDIETQILELINKERVAYGLSELDYNGAMQYYARLKSKDMGDNNYFSHYDLNGGLVKDKILADGLTYKAWGENIAYISNLHDYNALAVRFVNNWMNSQSHKENILSSNFTSVGIGVYKIGNTYYATQEFFK